MKLAAYDDFGTLQGIFDYEENYKINPGENLTPVLPQDDFHNHFDKDSNSWVIPVKQPSKQDEINGTTLAELGKIKADQAKFNATLLTTMAQDKKTALNQDSGVKANV